MLNIPAEYDYINAANSRVNPSDMHASNTGLSRLFMRYLWQKAISVLEFSGMPDTWEENYLLYGLYYWGHVAIVETSEFGPVPQWCTLYGYNIYYQPTRALVANPVFDRTYDLRIGSETELIKLSPDYGGIYDLVSYYADLLAIAAESMGVNMLNSKLSYVFAAANKASADSFKKLFDQVASGEPAAVIDKDLLNDDGTVTWQYFAQRIRENYIAPDVLQTMRQIEQEYDTIIGIPNANTDKRERLITDEVNANNVETQSRARLWLDTIRADLERVNNMFNLNISVDFRFKPVENKEVINNDPVETFNTGNV